MTLTTILADCYRRLNYESSPASAVSTRLTAFINDVQRQILNRHGMESLRRATLTFDSVASTATYALPLTVSRILAMTETTNDRRLDAMGVQEYKSIAPDPTSLTGTPERYVPMGFSAVSTQPSNASQLLVDSTAAETPTAYLESVRTGGYSSSVSTAMTGVTAKNLGPADVIAVNKFYLSAAAVGTVTLVEDVEGGTVLATIPIGSTFARYSTIALWPTPSAVIPYTVDAEREIPDMANGSDEPLLPNDFHWVITAGVRFLEYEKQDDTARTSRARQEFEQGIKDLRWWLLANPCAVVSANPRRRPASRLGAWYPAGT